MERKMRKLDVSHIGLFSGWIVFLFFSGFFIISFLFFRNADTGCCKTIPNGSIRERMLLVPGPHWAALRVSGSQLRPARKLRWQVQTRYVRVSRQQHFRSLPLLFLFSLFLLVLYLLTLHFFSTKNNQPKKEQGNRGGSKRGGGGAALLTLHRTTPRRFREKENVALLYGKTWVWSWKSSF